MKLRREKPERASNTEPTLGVASVRVEPSLAAAPARQRAPHIVWALGPGHDLRLSGEVVWSRKCDRFGAERVKTGIGIGGRCLGEEKVAHTQRNLLRRGLHPRTMAPLPPDVAFKR